MDTVTMKLYEGLFLLDSVEATADWQGTIGAIERVLERAGAEIVTIKKWDERKLAFELNQLFFCEDSRMIICFLSDVMTRRALKSVTRRF